MRTALILLLSWPALAGGPALVTLAKGDVAMVQGEDAQALPATPFVLQDGWSLRLADGATAVVLYEGAASNLRGPATVGIDGLQKPTTGTDNRAMGALSSVLERDASDKKFGASRGHDFQLLRPVHTDTVLAPGTIRWTCASCGEQRVELKDEYGVDVLWETRATGSVSYDGPKLAPGVYIVDVGGHTANFTVAATDQAKEVELAVKAARQAVADLDDPAARASVPAAVYARVGMLTEALRVVEDELARHPTNTDLTALLNEYEARTKP